MKRQWLAAALLLFLLALGLWNAAVLSRKTEALCQKAVAADGMWEIGNGSGAEEKAKSLLSSYEKDKHYFRCVLNQDRFGTVEETMTELAFRMEEGDEKESQKTTRLIVSALNEMIVTERISLESIF